MSRTRWTVVQHSAFGYGHDPTFEKGLEVRTLDRLKDQEVVLKAGGKLFDSYEEASLYEDTEAISGDGIYPRAPGTFSDKTIDGLKIYLPTAK